MGSDKPFFERLGDLGTYVIDYVTEIFYLIISYIPSCSGL